MSLATTGGGAGAGLSGGAGLSVAAMAHGGPNAGAIATQQPVHTHSGIPGGGGAAYGAAPGTSYAALGADLLDKGQSSLSARSVRSSAAMPIVAADVYGDGCPVSYFPPMEKDEGGEDDDEMAAMMKAMAKVKAGVRARSVGGLGSSNVVLKKDDSEAYRAVKRYLTKGEGHDAVLEDALADDNCDDDAVITIPRPHLVMGAKKVGELNAAARSSLGSVLPDLVEESPGSSPAIDQANTSAPLSITTINLDGNSAPKGDEYDRVAFQMRLSSKKKLMTILPEEALALLIAKCKKKVRDEYLKAHPESDLGDDDDDDEGGGFMDYPPAFAIPGWAAMDASVEALIDAAGGGSAACGPTLHQRSVAACVGALLPPPHSGAKAHNGRDVKEPLASSKLARLLSETMQGKDAEAAKEAARKAALERTDPAEPDPFVPLVVLAGATAEGIELTAVQVTKPQSPDKELHCPFGNISVVCSTCRASADPLGELELCLDELRAQVGVVVPESEEPTAFVTYGAIGTQVKLASKLKSILTKYGKGGKEDDDWDGWDQDIPTFSTKEECVSLGLAVLCASAHGRVRVVVSEKRSDGKHRPRAKLGVSVQDVATCAVAVSFNYSGGEGVKWTEPKTIFDFDRRVPAGPYRIDFTAAECAAHVRHMNKTGSTCMDDEGALIEATKAMEGGRRIPEREAAALSLRFRIHQRTGRGDGDSDDSGWIVVGKEMRPLSLRHSQKDEGEGGEEDYVAIESAVLEVSLNTVGLISTSLITNGETIVQATKSARNSKLLRWGGILGTVLFVGGFLVKSYVEERVFERDTRRVLAYYKHAAPNSFHDGDERQARYLVWKYKGKKDKLWRRLEAKYSVPVRHEWEWDDDEEEGVKEEEEEAEDLDAGEGGPEKQGDGGDEL